MKTLNEKMKNEYRLMIAEQNRKYPHRGEAIRRALDTKEFVMDLTVFEADMITNSCGLDMSYRSLFEIFE